MSGNFISGIADTILWYGKNRELTKFRELKIERPKESADSGFPMIELSNGINRRLTKNEFEGVDIIPKGRRFQTSPVMSAGASKEETPLEYQGQIYKPAAGNHWKISVDELKIVGKKGRLYPVGNTMTFKKYLDESPYVSLTNVWMDTMESTFAVERNYVVQTAKKVIERCVLLSTDPGDLVLDPTCGSGTTAYVAEQWGRRWITIDTSRIAINIAKQRLMTATFPYYKLYDNGEGKVTRDKETVTSGERLVTSKDRKVMSGEETVTSGERLVTSKERKVMSDEEKTNHSSLFTNHSSLTTHHFPDIRQGFIYKTVPHITLKSLANDEPPATETLYDQPETDKKKLRVSGPFTVETLQNFEPVSPEDLDREELTEDNGRFEETIKQHLLSAGIKNGRKDEMVIFNRVELLSNELLHAEGFYKKVVSGEWLVNSVSELEVNNGKAVVNGREVFIANEELKQFTGTLRKQPDGKWATENSTNHSTFATHHYSLTTHHYAETKAYFHIGPKFGTVSKKLVSDAIKECRIKGDADWLVILGFSFESDISGSSQTTSMGTFEVTKARIHDDLLQDGLKKKPAKSAASFVTIGEPDIEVVSDEWIVNSNNQIICNYGIFKKLSGLDSLAKINGLNDIDLRGYILLSQRRDVWINIANAKGSSFNFGEYCRRASEKFNWGVSSVLGDCERYFSGIRDFDYLITEIGLSEPGNFRQIVESVNRDKQNAQWFAQIPEITHLTTRHYSLATIKGLDIYDPIKDEVKPRNVHDIAYWMVDDDYDGSNFVVKQIFFCGGDKDEFDKWKKGLSEAAKQNTKQKAEKTLKIEINDEAFDRLYGHISHPIEVTRKEQKIAVRMISQFGEESTKVISL